MLFIFSPSGPLLEASSSSGCPTCCSPPRLHLPLTHPLQPHPPPRCSFNTPSSPALGPLPSPLSHLEHCPGLSPFVSLSGLCFHFCCLHFFPLHMSEMLWCVPSLSGFCVSPQEIPSTLVPVTFVSPAPSPGLGTQQSSGSEC